jgi:predicted RNA binding protein YcfA (HicA-like mRNA interferase family)
MAETLDELRRRAVSVSADDLIGYAMAPGWRYVGVGGGGHHKLVKPGTRSLMVPNHRRVPRGTVLSILAKLRRDMSQERGTA